MGRKFTLKCIIHLDKDDLFTSSVGLKIPQFYARYINNINNTYL